jgi:GNAT superfamily N-acetyltransferase
MLYYGDVTTHQEIGSHMSDCLSIEPKRNRNEISATDLNCLFNQKGKFMIERHFRERFPKGAILWLLRVNQSVAGYRWTMRGNSIKPHFYPLTAKDAHFFDVEIFPEYRGRGLNSFFINYVLARMKNEGVERAFIEMREWNKSNRRSIRKTSFKNIGIARKYVLFGKKIVIWSKW